ncbi:outer membrane protein assembly factor BamE (lipoprotein component of BamABCDE complex) [Paraburkholderia sp. GAS448]|uniref:hypothetical protein n=1 Tax=Paraburkholderia sp. GAS448 TaxID=3035136 RepID=UPI003D216CA7
MIRSGMEMKAAMALNVLVAASLLGLGGCVTQTYDEVHVRNWTRESIEQQFPAGTSKKQVFARMGNPISESSTDGVTRWVYQGGSGQDQVTFVFQNEKLVDTRFAAT